MLITANNINLRGIETHPHHRRPPRTVRLRGRGIGLLVGTPINHENGDTLMQNSNRHWTYEDSEEVKTLVGLYFITRSSAPLYGCIIGQPCPGYFFATCHCGSLSELARADGHMLVRPEEMDGWSAHR